MNLSERKQLPNQLDGPSIEQCLFPLTCCSFLETKAASDVLIRAQTVIKAMMSFAMANSRGGSVLRARGELLAVRLYGG